MFVPSYELCGSDLLLEIFSIELKHDHHETDSLEAVKKIFFIFLFKHHLHQLFSESARNPFQLDPMAQVSIMKLLAPQLDSDCFMFFSCSKSYNSSRLNGCIVNKAKSSNNETNSLYANIITFPSYDRY